MYMHTDANIYMYRNTDTHIYAHSWAVFRNYHYDEQCSHTQIYMKGNICTSGQKYKITLKNGEKDIVYNF